MEPLTTFVATSFNESREHSPFVDSLLAQSDKNWKAIIFNNGPRLVDWVQPVDGRITYINSETNTGKWGCLNREQAVKELVHTPFVINTSIQDYYLSCFVGELNKVLLDPTIDLVHWQAINHLFNHSIINGEFAWGHIDWGQFCCRTELIKRTGIVHPDNFSGDFHTLQAIRQYVKKSHKIDRVLTIHN